jgi:hypothetical protein
MEERKVWTMGEPVQAYFLYVNQIKVPEVFMTREEAEETSKSHLESQAALQIKTTWGAVRTWNYRYDLKQWVEMMGRAS